MNKTSFVSKCCKASYFERKGVQSATHGGEEATYYICSRCKNGCDLVDRSSLFNKRKYVY